jgi:hypothetical protein
VCSFVDQRKVLSIFSMKEMVLAEKERGAKW